MINTTHIKTNSDSHHADSLSDLRVERVKDPIDHRAWQIVANKDRKGGKRIVLARCADEGIARRVHTSLLSAIARREPEIDLTQLHIDAVGELLIDLRQPGCHEKNWAVLG